jgi:Arc/MetJ-type ribon-helix-helix transcriptional regulator
MPTKNVTITLPADLVKALDKAAKAEYSARSDYIRKALVSQLHQDARKSDLKELLYSLADDITDSVIAPDSPYHYLSFKDFVENVMKFKNQPQA